MRTTHLLTALALVLTAGGASAATLDFTDAGFATSGTLGGVGYTVTAQGGALNNSQRYDGGNPTPANSFDLLFQRDGFGVGRGDDEITARMGGSEAITVTFDRAVRATGFAFLDLFRDDIRGDRDEVGVMTVDGGASVAVFAGTNRAGYAERLGLGLVGTEFVFTVRDGNDSRGMPDGALAALEVSAVPIPAAGLLLAGALGGLGLARRRKG